MTLYNSILLLETLSFKASSFGVDAASGGASGGISYGFGIGGGVNIGWDWSARSVYFKKTFSSDMQ